jgi:phosphate/sulfate permease
MNARNVFLIIASWVISPALGFVLGYGLTQVIG